MDINDLRALVTLISFLVFAGIMVWTTRANRRADFEEAAQLPFNDEESMS